MKTSDGKDYEKLHQEALAKSVDTLDEKADPLLAKATEIVKKIKWRGSIVPSELYTEIAAALREKGADEFARGTGAKCIRHDRAWGCSGCSLEDRYKADAEGFRRGLEEAAKVVERRMERNAIATKLFTLPENALAVKVEAWMFDAVYEIRALAGPK